MIPSRGSKNSAGDSGSASTARMAIAVPNSVASTVASMPKRAPSQPQANLPAAPPRKSSVKASPTSGSSAPFAWSRKGRKIRKPMRAALSSTPMASSRLKPPRLAPPVLFGVVLAAATRGKAGTSRWTATAASRPRRASSHSAGRQGMTASNSAVSAGSAALPRSPAKL